MRRSVEKVYPKDLTSYYVYALCKPCGTPFYIGKGKAYRINEHFKPCNLKVNTPKNQTIKKYGNTIKREILSYFDKEDNAFTFEEYLISYYGIMSEGGLLTNYAKTRYEYSKSFIDDVCKKAHVSREYKYSEQVVLDVYNSWFKYCNTTAYVSLQTGVPTYYIHYLVTGKKHKKFYTKYVINGLVKNNRNTDLTNQNKIDQLRRSKESYKALDDRILEAHAVWLSEEKSIPELAKTLNISPSHLYMIFEGKKRKYLRLKGQPTRVVRKTPNSLISKILDLYKSGSSFKAINKELGVAKTTFYRIIRDN